MQDISTHMATIEVSIQREWNSLRCLYLGSKNFLKYRTWESPRDKNYKTVCSELYLT